MRCDVTIYINGKVYKVIEKEESSEELSSFDDLASFIANEWSENGKGKQFLTALYRSPKVVENSSIYKGKSIIGNSSIDHITALYPEIKELLEGLPEQKYNITLVDKALTNGKPFKGRLVGNTVVSHIIRNKYDAENFARTERIKYEANQVIDKNTIKDDYLNKKYSAVLEKIRSKRAKKIKEHIKLVNPSFDGDINIWHLIEDFLNYKDDYQSLLTIKKTKDNPEETIDAYSKLYDFCRELQKQQVFNEDSETDIARRFRALNYKRESIGKKDFYEVVQSLGTPEQKEIIESIGLQEFINMSLEEMQELYTNLFTQDPILSRYKITDVEETKEETITLNKSQVEKLIEKRNKILPKERQVDPKSLITVEGVNEFFDNDIQYVTKTGQPYPVNVEKMGETLVYSYSAKTLNNDNTIKLKKQGRSLREEFDFGYNTLELITAVNDNNEDGLGAVVNGEYHSYYIYEFKPTKNNTIYIVSKSLMHPELYDPPRFNNLTDAKLAVQGFIRSANIKNSSDIEIKKYIQDEERTTRQVLLQHPVTQGSTISSIRFPIRKNTQLNQQELKMFKNSTISEVQNIYNKYGIDISALDTPEKVGIFLYAMTEEGLTIEELEKSTNLKEAKDRANKIITRISKAPVDHYLVDKWYIKTNSKTSKKEGYMVSLKSVREAKINSVGMVPMKNSKFWSVEKYVKSKSFFDLQKNLNNGLFKDTGVSVKIISAENAKQLKSDNGEYLFTDEEFLGRVKGFVHNNDIYIIKNNANIDDLVHETFHILFGAIKVYNPYLYSQLIEHYYTNDDMSDSYKTYVDKNYSTFSKLDRMEEAVVRNIASRISGNFRFFNTEKINDLDKFLMRQFTDLYGTIKKVITESNNGTDLDFPTTINSLLKDKDTLTKMQQNRLITNAIEKGIRNGTILRSSENC